MKRYSISHELAEKICVDFGLSIDDEIISMYKPNVFENTLTKQKSLCASLAAIDNLDNFIFDLFVDDYSGFRWLFHRVIWKLKPLRHSFFLILLWIKHPTIFFSFLVEKMQLYKSKNKSKDNDTINSIFTEQDLSDLAKLVKANYATIPWQCKDVLIFDNTQIAHAGMPGFGPRTIRVILANPLKINYSKLALGIQQIEEHTSNTLGEIATAPPLI